MLKVPAEADFTAWDLSGDGKRVAIATFDHKASDVKIITLADKATTKLSAMPTTGCRWLGRRWEEPLPPQLLLARDDDRDHESRRQTKSTLQATQLGHLLDHAIARWALPGLRPDHGQRERVDDCEFSEQVN